MTVNISIHLTRGKKQQRKRKKKIYYTTKRKCGSHRHLEADRQANGSQFMLTLKTGVREEKLFEDTHWKTEKKKKRVRSERER